MQDLEDTICALSSAPGRAGIAVVRVSGPRAFESLRRIFKPKGCRREDLPPRHAVLGTISDPRTPGALDQALVTCFPAPHSYTGEDVAEISLHGSPVLVSALLDVLCHCGARLADPGEFTMRAFVHGRMDLTQAEAVQDVVCAKTLYQAQVAARQRSGDLSRRLQPAKKLLVDVIVQLESSVEFVEENLPIESRAELARKLTSLQADLSRWIDSFRQGRLIREGFSLAIIGRPNVGKSSLFNALLAEDRSIVTEIPGTTRDVVTEYANIDGILVRLVDTAGVRVSQDLVEQLGVDRSYRAMADADALLLVVDASERRAVEDTDLRARAGALSGVVVFNKADLRECWSVTEKEHFAGEWPQFTVSALTGQHLADLRASILERVFGDRSTERDGLLVTNIRHCHCLEAAESALSNAVAALRDGLSEEFVLVDLRRGLEKLGEITGETTVEDLLGEIFSRFCVGK